MTTTTAEDFDRHMAAIAAGERLPAEVIRGLAAMPDILPLGMLADALRRRLHGTQVTYVRVATCAVDGSFADAVPPAAGEIRITGTPASLDMAAAAVRAARAIAGDRAVSGWSWGDVTRLANSERPTRVLRALRDAGLDAIAEVALDTCDEPAAAVEQLQHAGFDRLRLTIEKLAAADRTDLLLQAFALQERFGCIQAISPLPTAISTFRPTTGYEDVKLIGVARLAVPNVPHVQVDWARYGPKLAQVALTFGADDVDAVSPFDTTPEGRRRAPLEEIRRNIQAAGFEPAERDGRFAVL